MNLELDHDLTAWADGRLSREDLMTLHGDEARGLVGLHERLLGAAETAAPDPVAGWALLQTKMGATVVSIGARRRPGLRRAALAVAATLVIGGGAFAAVGGVGVDRPSVPGPPAGRSAPKHGTHERPAGLAPGASGLAEEPSSKQSSSSTAPTGGSGDATQGSTGSDGTGDSGGGTASGSTDSGGGSGSGGSDTNDSGGEHRGQGNGGEDNGNEGPHAHGGASSSSSHG